MRNQFYDNSKILRSICNIKDTLFDLLILNYVVPESGTFFLICAELKQNVFQLLRTSNRTAI